MTKNMKKKKTINLELVLSVLCSIPLAALLCPYTIITVYSTTRRQYISGDFLYDKQINDDLNLLKTVQVICGYSFALVYCNLYLMKILDNTGNLYGKPGFYGKIIIPDYTIKFGISIYMLLKVVVIIGTIFASLYFSDFFMFKNDLGKFNLNQDDCKYDDKNEITAIFEKKKNIANFLWS